MIKKLLTNLRVDRAHPAEEKLLGCIDGELTARQTNRVRRHLEACWPCRASLDRIEGTISLFVEFQLKIQGPATPNPPGNWGGFSGRLQQRSLAGARPPKSIGKEVAQAWQGLTGLLRPSNWSRTMVRVASGSLAMILIAVLVWHFVSIRPVSASEFFDRAVASDTAKVNTVSDAVVYQKIRVGRSNAAGFDWEVWRDPANRRYRQATSGNIANSLSDILAANRMNPKEPLSPESFRAWHDSLAQREDEVSRATGSGGERLLLLRTVNTGAQQIGEILRGVLSVRESDWHAIREELYVKNSNGEEKYELIELEFNVVSRSSLKPDFFDAAAPAVSKPGPESSSEAKPNPLTPTPDTRTPTSPLPLSPSPAATAELEVEVLRLLHQAGADTGEQVSLTRTPTGQLRVEGIIDTASRKAELVRALSPVANSPGLVIDINTIAEALERQKRNQRGATATVTTGPSEIETTAETFPAYSDLRKHFSDEETRRFAAQIVNVSDRAMRHAGALKQLGGRFTAQAIESLDAEAQTKLLGLMQAHARAFQTENIRLRRELQIAFPELSAGEPQTTGRITNAAELLNAVVRLFEMSVINDRAVRAAFTVSSGGTTSGVKSAQFYRSLLTVESLTQEIQNARLQRER